MPLSLFKIRLASRKFGMDLSIEFRTTQRSALPLLVRPPRLLGARYCKVLWPLLTPHLCHTWTARPPPVRAFPFIQSLQYLHNYPFCFLWALSRGLVMLAYPDNYASYSTVLLFISSNVHRTFGFSTEKLNSIHCSSVPDFAVVFAL